VKISVETYDAVKMDMLMFLNTEISRASRLAGNREKLSIMLGHAENYVRKIIKRQSYSAMERLWKECRGKTILID
jgi:hypothetical protein